jgi:pyruvate formate lyase activating enzyme
MELLRDGCTVCARCTDACPTGALTLAGEQKNIDELLGEIEKDAHYYESSHGGVTFSGGECLLQSKFVAELSKQCHARGIHTAVETALYVPWKNVQDVLSHTDLFFADLKIADSKKHREFTGCSNELIIENLKKLSSAAKELIIRIPVIPSVNDGEDDIEGFASVLKTLGGALKHVELLKYNNLAKSKYDIAGMRYESFADEAQSDEQMKALAAALSDASGIKCAFN